MRPDGEATPFTLFPMVKVHGCLWTGHGSRLSVQGSRFPSRWSVGSSRFVVLASQSEGSVFMLLPSRFNVDSSKRTVHGRTFPVHGSWSTLRVGGWRVRIHGQASSFADPGIEVMVQGSQLRVHGSWLPSGWEVGSSEFVVHN